MRANVYLVTNSIDGKTYVGVTRFTPEFRWGRHQYVAQKKAKTYLHRAILKHGAENFTVCQVATVLDIADASAVEREVIKSFRPEYNQTNGGEFTVGKRVPREVVERIIAGNVGKKRTPEMNVANSERKKLQYKNEEYKRAVSIQLSVARRSIDQTKRISAASESSKNRVWSDESKAKLSASCKGRKYSREVIEAGARKKDKPVVCTTLNMSFDSVSCAAEFTGLSISGVSCVCRGKRNSANGLHFEFVTI